MNKTALITGASSGIGAAIALALAKKGCNIAVGCHSQTSAERGGAAVAGQCREFGVKADCFIADVADFEACGRMIAQVAGQFGGIDLLVNNAGIARDGLVVRMSEKSFDEVIDTSLKGAFCAIRHVSPLMMRKRSGKIINISSVAGLCGNPGQANYAAAKAGLIGMTKAVAKELGSRGITCNAIAPGYIETDMTRGLPEQTRRAIVDSTCLRRAGRPEEVAHAVVFLAENDFVTGQVLVVDGGMAV